MRVMTARAIRIFVRVKRLPKEKEVPPIGRVGAGYMYIYYPRRNLGAVLTNTEYNIKIYA